MGAEPSGAFAPASGVSAPDALGAATAAAVAADDEDDTLESQIGGRWLLYIGIAALVLGASYFVKFAFDNEWINEPLRVGIGFLFGVGLLVGGQRFVARGLAPFGQALTGAGVGVLYLVIYAAYRWYALVGQPEAFASMVVITALGVWLADRQRSQPLALLAIIAGFCTPFLIGERGGSQIVLFTYDAVLVCGTLALARRREWPVLNLVSYALTLFTLGTWLDVEYRPRAWLVTELFLTLFLVLFLYVWRETRRYTASNRASNRAFNGASIGAPATAAGAAPGAAPAAATGAALASFVLALAPVLYHAASLSILFPQRGALLVYLIAFSAAGAIASRKTGTPWLRLLVWIGVALPMLAFLGRGVPSGWVPAAWIALLAIYGLHVVAQIDRLHEDEVDRRHEAGLDRSHDEAPDAARSLPGIEIFLLHANAIWLLIAADTLLAPRIADVESRVALVLAIGYGLLTLAARAWRRDVALHTTALTCTFLAATAGFYFDGPWLTAALALDGAALIWLALKAERRWMHVWGAVILAIGIVRVLFLLTEAAPVSYLPLVNPHALAGFFVVAVMAVLAWRYPRAGGGTLPGARDTLVVAAHLLMLIVLSSEVDAYFSRRAWETVGPLSPGGRGTVIVDVETAAELSRELSLSILWAVYAVGLVFAGIRRRYRPIRYLAILLFGFTILKVFFVDIARLDRVSKMLSVMGLGVLLLIASYLYQRVRADAGRQTPTPSAPPPAPPPAPPLAPPSESAAGAQPGSEPPIA
jgi:uncharacterized membrane protein